MQTNQARNWYRERTIRHTQQPEKQKVIVKVRKKSWLTKGEKLIYSVVAAAFVIACLFIVSFSSKTDGLNRQVQGLEADVVQYKLTNEELNFEISELSKPERITKIAKEHGLKIQDTQVKRALQAE